MDPFVGQLLSPHYEAGPIALSYVISFFGSLLALLCADKMVRRDGTLDLSMLACGAVALGGIGIWSMHFIGMVAYRLPVPIAHDVPLTAVSLIAAVVLSGAALYLAGGKRFTRGGWLAGSLVAGIGVCVMHYIGMFAMNMRASMSFDPVIVAASVAIAIGAAAAALWLAFNLTELAHQFVAAAVMGGAVCAMHYTGMVAATMVCTSSPGASSFLVGDGNLGLAVFNTASVALIFIFSRIEIDDWLDNVRAKARIGALPSASAHSGPPAGPRP
ncbi:MHYT domain (predicted integral membrane sensor domain) [Variovorax sp. PBS-H4]|uniref:MHYT domain-containing protein n=1 Tax=Variovorax sp. PBS-H4 TaxID=434008 RepID=UPI001317B54D|nr:MHYT domain-containing protein [Variovorax sp. PBS-H4]VTU25771.1 MHYT domain (predicted integral membrane sensor domain) [Variovorax sp. PBS-H4]